MSWQQTACLIFLSPFAALCAAFLAAEGVKIAVTVRTERRRP